MKIRAAVARKPHAPLSLESLELGPVRDDEILVRNVATGICHTDIAMRDQVFPVPQPIVLGHEGAGIVEQTGSGVHTVAVGDHVVMSFNSCGACASCRHGLPSYCHDFFGRNFAGQRADGSTRLATERERVHGNFFGQSSFASHSMCNERNIVKVPMDLALESLGPLACGIQTGAGAVINALRVGFGDSIVVFGAGSVGISAIMAASAVGAGHVIAIDPREDRLRAARELGATLAFAPAGVPDLVAEIRKMTSGGAQFSFDTTGLPTVLRQAAEVLAPRGVCGFVGAAPPGTDVSFDMMDLMTQGKQLRGIVEGESVPDIFIPQMIDLHRKGRFPFDRLISYYPFERINDAIHDSETGRVIKAVIRF